MKFLVKFYGNFKNAQISKGFLYFSTSFEERKRKKSLRFARFHFSKLIKSFPVWGFVDFREVRKLEKPSRLSGFWEIDAFDSSNLRNRTRRRLVRRLGALIKFNFDHFGSKRYGVIWWPCHRLIRFSRKSIKQRPLQLQIFEGNFGLCLIDFRASILGYIVINNVA